MSHTCTPILVGGAFPVSEILVPSKTAKFPFPTMDYIVHGHQKIYCKTTNFSVLLILVILANGIKTLILIPANIYNQSRGRTR